jgi:hypothetical protein
MKELDTDISMNNHHSAALAAGCLWKSQCLR